MKIIKKIGLLTIIIVLILSCGKEKTTATGLFKMSDTSNDIELEELLEEPASVANKTVQQDKSIAQKIIKTSYLSFETESIEKTFQSIQKQVQKYNGFIQTDNISKDYNRISRTITIRIPTQSFQTIINHITHDVKTFDQKQITLKDVTEEFIDLNARLKAKKALETRYLQLLVKAKNVKEMLQIEREIAKIREEIEAKQGRLKYLNNQVSLSTINLDFYEFTPVVKSKSKTYFSRVIQALKGGFSGFGSFVVNLLYIWPFLIILGIAFYYIRKKLKK